MSRRNVRPYEAVLPAQHDSVPISTLICRRQPRLRPSAHVGSHGQRPGWTGGRQGFPAFRVAAQEDWKVGRQGIWRRPTEAIPTFKCCWRVQRCCENRLDGWWGKGGEGWPTNRTLVIRRAWTAAGLNGGPHGGPHCVVVSGLARLYLLRPLRLNGGGRANEAEFEWYAFCLPPSAPRLPPRLGPVCAPAADRGI